MMTKEDRENHSMPYAEKIAKTAFFLLMLFSTLSPGINVLIDSISNRGVGNLTGEGSSTRIALYAVVLTLTVWSMRNFRCQKDYWPIPIEFSVAILWFVLSQTWAINPEVGIRRLVLTIVIIWATFALVRINDFDSTISILRAVFAITLFANFLAVLFFPSIGITEASATEGTANTWRGFVGDKNYAGPVCAITILVFMFGAHKVHRLHRLIIMLAATYFLIQTDSKTSIGLTAICILIGLIYSLYEPYYKIIIIITTPVILLVAIVFFVDYKDWFMTEISGYLDDPESLTGRVQIWPLLWEFFNEHPFLGSGFGSFWNIGATSPIFNFTDSWVSEIASGHNGYLDLLVQVGLPGLIISMTAVFFIPLAKLFFGEKLPKERSALISSVLSFTLGHNLTESSLFDRDSMIFVLLLLMIAILKLPLKNKPFLKPEFI